MSVENANKLQVFLSDLNMMKKSSEMLNKNLKSFICMQIQCGEMRGRKLKRTRRRRTNKMFNDFILPSCMKFYVSSSSTVCISRFQDTNFLLLNIQIEEKKNAEMEKNCRLSYLNREDNFSC